MGIYDSLTPAEQKQAQTLGNQMYQATIKRQKKPKDRGNLFTNSLTTIGGIGGGILGSFAGPGLGTAAGGAAGAGLGKILENALEGNKQDVGGIAGEAAFGTLGGVGKAFKAGKLGLNAIKTGQGVSKAAQALRFGEQGLSATSALAPKSNFISRIGANMERGGNKMLASQSDLTAAQARQAGINPVDVFGNIGRRTGLKSIDDMSEVSRSLTGGKDSILDTMTNAAVGNSKGIDIPNLRNTASQLLDDQGSLISDGARKKLLSNMTRSGVSMRGGSKGDLSGLADPTKALKEANAFRGNARELTNNFTATPEQKQLAKVYNGLAKGIEDSIYKSPGVNDSIPMLKKAVSDDLLFKAQDLRAAGNKAQAKAHEKIAKEVLGVGAVSDVRSMKKDFVDLGKIDRATAQAQGARSINGSDITNKAGNIIRNPMNIVATPLDMATPTIANGISRAGRALQGIGSPSGVKSQAIKAGALQIPAQALTGQYNTGVDPTEQVSYDQLPTEQALGDFYKNTGIVPVGELGTEVTNDALSKYMSDQSQGGQQDMGGSVYSRESAAQDIQHDLQATGGKNMDKYMALYEFMNPEDKEKSKLGKVSAQQNSLATSGKSSLNQLQGMLQSNPSLISKTAIPGQDLPLIGGLISNLAGTSDYNAVSDNVLDALARARTGAAMTKTEEEFYRRLLPRAGDNEQTRQTKLSQLSQSFAPFL